jgi:hypothetical protein
VEIGVSGGIGRTNHSSTDSSAGISAPQTGVVMFTTPTKEHDMRSTEIHKLVEEGILLVAPVRVRRVADIPRVRAALAAPRR